MSEFPKYPKLSVTVTLEGTCDCQRCPVVVPPFTRLFVLAYAVDTPTMGQPLCWECGTAEAERRERELKAAHESPAAPS